MDYKNNVFFFFYVLLQDPPPFLLWAHNVFVQRAMVHHVYINNMIY